MQDTIYRPCPKCLPDHNGDFDHEGEHNAEGLKVYRCRNCRYPRVLKPRPPKRDAEGLTAKQRRVIERLRHDLIAIDGGGEHYRDRYEFKRFEIKVSERKLVFVTTTVGSKTDEGTWGMISRTNRHILVGPRGGVELLNAKEGKKVRGYWNVTHHGETY